MLPVARVPPGLRRIAAALLLATVVALLARGLLADTPTDGEPVLVARREVPIGALLTAGDVELRPMPAQLVPEGAVTDPSTALGMPVSAVLTPGQVVTAHAVRTGSLLRGQPGGTSAMWLPLPDLAVAQGLSAGDRVDVHSPVDGAPVVLEVLVVAARSPGPGGSGPAGLMGGSGGAREAPGVWLAVSAEQARALAAARGADPAGGALLLAIHPSPG